MRVKGYVEWIYSTHFAEKTKPAVYYLGLNGVRYLRKFTTPHEDCERLPTYPPEELRKRYKESTRSQAYIDRCILLADCCVSLSQQITNQLNYFHQTEADYLLENS